MQMWLPQIFTAAHNSRKLLQEDTKMKSLPSILYPLPLIVDMVEYID